MGWKNIKADGIPEVPCDVLISRAGMVEMARFDPNEDWPERKRYLIPGPKFNAGRFNYPADPHGTDWDRVTHWMLMPEPALSYEECWAERTK